MGMQQPKKTEGQSSHYEPRPKNCKMPQKREHRAVYYKLARAALGNSKSDWLLTMA
jgi:hypothetical protein